MKHLAVVGLIASTALALGLPWVRRLTPTGAERVAVAVAVGLALAGQLALGLGLVGLLQPIPVITLVVVAHLAAWRDLRDLACRARWAWMVRTTRARWLAAAVGVLALPFVLCAFYPPLAFDETLYHLPYARAFARTGSLPFLADLRYPIFPQLVEALFAAILLLAGDVATHGVSLVATLAAAAIVAVWSAVAGVGMAAAGIAVAFLLGHPIAVHLTGSAYVEPAAALFAVAAGYSADRWRTGGHRGWLLVAGLLAGSAASTKYLGLLILAGVSIQVAVLAVRRRVIGDLAAYGAVAVAALAVTYGRLLLQTGNPVFPFFPEIFGSTPWDATSFLGRRGIERWAALPTLPWDVVFDRHAVGGLPPFSPLLPLAVPILLIGAWWSPPVRAWLAWAAGFVLLAPISAHYLWIVMPFLALAFGVSCARMLGHRRRLALAVGMLCVAPGWLYGGFQLARLGPMPGDEASRAALLSARLPLFPAVEFLNRRCGATCTIYTVGGERMVYFAAGRLLGDWNGPASYARTLAPGGGPAALLTRLRALGVDHLLVSAQARAAMGLAGADASAFRLVYSDRGADVYALSP